MATPSCERRSLFLDGTDLPLMTAPRPTVLYVAICGTDRGREDTQVIGVYTAEDLALHAARETHADLVRQMRSQADSPWYLVVRRPLES